MCVNFGAARKNEERKKEREACREQTLSHPVLRRAFPVSGLPLKKREKKTGWSESHLAVACDTTVNTEDKTKDNNP